MLKVIFKSYFVHTFLGEAYQNYSQFSTFCSIRSPKCPRIIKGVVWLTVNYLLIEEFVHSETLVNQQVRKGCKKAFYKNSPISTQLVMNDTYLHHHLINEHVSWGIKYKQCFLEQHLTRKK